MNLDNIRHKNNFSVKMLGNYNKFDAFFFAIFISKGSEIHLCLKTRQIWYHSKDLIK